MMIAAAPVAAPLRNRPVFSFGLAIVALAGVPAIWLSFAHSTSPASALFEHGFFNLWPLAWPHLLAIPIAAALFRWAARRRLSHVERWCGRLLAVAACCATAWLYVGANFDGNWPSDVREWIGFFLPIVILAGGAAFTVWAVRSGRAPDGLDAIMLMEVVYLNNVVLCLQAAGGLSDGLELGGYASLLTSVVYVLHMVAVLSSRPSRVA